MPHIWGSQSLGTCNYWFKNIHVHDVKEKQTPSGVVDSNEMRTRPLGPLGVDLRHLTFAYLMVEPENATLQHTLIL